MRSVCSSFDCKEACASTTSVRSLIEGVARTLLALALVGVEHQLEHDGPVAVEAVNRLEHDARL